MTKSLAVCLVTLAIATAVLFTSAMGAVAQQLGLYWAVMFFKIELVPGQPLMQIAGPFPSESACQTTLAAAVETLRRQGIELASQVCRSDVTITLP